MNELLRPGSFKVEPFEDRVGTLFHELELAIKWQRPSILFAIYNASQMRREASSALESRLISLGQKIHRFEVNESDDPDIALTITEAGDLDQAVLFVEGLGNGAEREGLNVYSTLNTRREYFSEHKLRVVFWLTEDEVIDLANHAPDYWTFRHRVIEFTDEYSSERYAQNALEAAWNENSENPTEPRALDTRISLEESLLTDLPPSSEPTASYASRILSLGILNWRKGNHDKASGFLQAAKEISEFLHDKGLEAQCLNAIALLKTGIGDLDGAISAYERSLELNPDQKFPRSRLETLYRKNGSEVKTMEANHLTNHLTTNRMPAGVPFSTPSQDKESAHAAGRHLKDADIWKQKAGQFGAEGKTREAIQAYQKAIEFNRLDCEAWIGLGRQLDAFNQPKAAIKAYRKALEIDPGVEVWQEIGLIYLNNKAYPHASAAFQRAIKQNPESGRLYRYLGQAAMGQDLIDDAVRYSLKGLVLMEGHQDESLAWKQVGEVLLKKDDLKNAGQAFQMADELAKQKTVSIEIANSAVSMDLSSDGASISAEAEASRENSQMEEEIRIAEQQADRWPSIGDSTYDYYTDQAREWNDLGNQHLRAGEYNEAITAYMRAVEMDPQFNWPYIKNLALANYQKGKHKISMKYASLPSVDFSDAAQVEEAPVHIYKEEHIHEDLVQQEVGVDLITTFERREPSRLANSTIPAMGGQVSSNWQENTVNSPADEAYETALEPSLIPVPANELANWLVELDKFVSTAPSQPRTELAAEAIQEHIPPVPRPAEYPEVTGQEIVGEGQSYEAVEVEEELPSEYNFVAAAQEEIQVELMPQNSYEWNELGMIYLKTGSYDAAVAAFSRALELNPKDGWASFNLGSTYHHMGKFEEALPLYQQSVDLFDRSEDKANALNRLGDLFRRLDDHKNARLAYQQANTLTTDHGTILSRARLSLLGNAR